MEYYSPIKGIKYWYVLSLGGSQENYTDKAIPKCRLLLHNILEVTKIIDTENRLAVARGRWGGGGLAVTIQEQYKASL